MKFRTAAVCIVLVLATVLPARAYLCPLPSAFLEGRMQGYWVGVMLNFAGEAGAPHTATVYTTMLTGSGIKLTTLGTVHAQGPGAAELHGMFVNDALYMVNDRYAPGKSSGQYEYFAIQRFHIQMGKLIPDAQGILNLSLLPPGLSLSGAVDCGDVSGFDNVLRKVIESGKLERLWTRETAKPDLLRRKSL